MDPSSNILGVNILPWVILGTKNIKKDHDGVGRGYLEKMIVGVMKDKDKDPRFWWGTRTHQVLG